MNILTRIALLVIAGALCSLPAQAQTTSQEDFTGAHTGSNWYYFNGACLTAGTDASNGSNGVTAGLIPGCANILSSYYSQQHDHDPILTGGQSDPDPGSGVSNRSNHTSTWADTAGNGALRFTNGYPFGHNENGAIVSSTPFDAGNGVQITFKTVTYRGDSGGGSHDGADGMSFYLIDADNYKPDNSAKPWNGIGSWGGSLGYTCSNANPPYDGLNGGYIGLGIDEYGNFLNGSSLVSATSSGGTVGTATGDNTALGYGYVPQRIGLRGAGSISWAYLNSTYPTYYPTTVLNTTALRQAAVQKTCQTGQVQNYALSASAPTPVISPSPAFYGYAPIPDAFAVLPSTTPIAAEFGSGSPTTGTTNRTQATPIFYKLTITQDGLLSLAYAFSGSPSYTSIISNRSISSTNALSSLPAHLYFGFAGSSGGSTNIHEIMCFKAAPATTSSTSATVSQQLSTKIQGGTQVYFSYYNPNDWTGRVTANSLIDTAGVLSIQALSTWDAQCNLSNDTTCATVGTAPPTSAVLSDSQRQILSWNANDSDTTTNAGSAGIVLSWNNLSTGTGGQQAALMAGGDTTTTAQARLNYLRGSRTNEINSSGSGLFRARNGVLGDVIDSSPAWVGPPNAPYSQTWIDRYLTGWTNPAFTSPATNFPENSGQVYQSFKNLEAARLNVLYVGANDGMLHAFETGSQDSNGVIVDNSTTPNDGKEVLAYMPGFVLDAIHQTSANVSHDFSNSRYSHSFYVDGTPGTGDLYYSGAWHTWLVSGSGIGVSNLLDSSGNPKFSSGIFALEITNPNSAVTNANAPLFSSGATPNTSVVIGEWSNNSITCANVSNCGQNLGSVTGSPLFRKLHNGYWGVIFGNGLGSASGDAGIYIMMVSPTDGSKSFYYFSTNTSGTSNGINNVTAADFDGDHISDYVYAGDANGNVWRFDLTQCAPTATTSGGCPTWGVNNWGGGTSSSSAAPFKLFYTGGQPITTPIVLASAVIQGPNPSVMVVFGTGKRTQFTDTTQTTYASGTQSMYGVWDWNFAPWNVNSTFDNQSITSTINGASVDQTQLGSNPIRRTNLQAQTYAAGTSGTIVATTTTIAWRTCTSTTLASCSGTKFGWYVDLPGSGEQIVSPPQAFAQAVTVNSTIPANNAVLSCTNNTDQGITYVFSPLTGGTFTNTNGTAASAFINNNSQTGMVGLLSNETGGLTVVNTVQGTTYLIGQGITPGTAGTPPAQPIPITLPPNVSVNRKTWVQLR